MLGAGGVDDDPIGRIRSDDGCEALQQASFRSNGWF